MSWFKNSTLVFLVIFGLIAKGVVAHTYLSSVYLADGTSLVQGDCVRPHPSTAFDSPIPLVTQDDMTCGWLPYAAEAANRKCPIEAGTTIGIQWHHNSNASSDDIIDSSHLGPVMVYMAKSDSGNGSVWFKIYEDGYVNGEWAVTRLLANGGRLNFTIPKDIEAGDYLIRGEIIALHGAYVLYGAQPYVGCVEVTVSSSGSSSPSTVALPGAYSATDPGIYLSIYSGLTSYTIPGPAVYEAGDSTSTSTSSPTSSATVSPTSSATASPTSSATSAPTSAATSAPTSAATSTPTSSATTSTSSSSSIKLQVNAGSSAWWFAVEVSGGSETTTKVELKDSGSVSAYVTLPSAQYIGYYFSESIELTLPLTLRLTSSSGSQVVLSSIITSWAYSSVLDTNTDYSSSSSSSSTSTTKPTTAPTTKPTTSTTTTAPTTAPTTRPTTTTTTSSVSSSSVILTQHSSSSAWWFAVGISGIDSSSISSISLKDSSTVSSYSNLATTNYGYYIFSTTGNALVVPISVKVTTTSGSSLTAIFTEFGSVSESASS